MKLCSCDICTQLKGVPIIACQECGAAIKDVDFNWKRHYDWHARLERQARTETPGDFSTFLDAALGTVRDAANKARSIGSE